MGPASLRTGTRVHKQAQKVLLCAAVSRLLTQCALAFTVTDHTTLDDGPCCNARQVFSPIAQSGTQKEISGCSGSPLRQKSVFRAGGRNTARQISNDTAQEIYSL